MRLIILITLLTLSFSSFAAVYRWVDENGKVHYSDEPQSNASEMELNKNTQNTISINPPKLLNNNSNQTNSNINYSVAILSPSEEATIRSNTGTIKVSASISPRLPQGAFYTLLLNGQIKVQPQASSMFTLSNVDRGEHTIVVNVVTQNGKVLASSSPRTIFLHRASL
ncbi:DUF4124 domain-containing protein [Shewanella intestini]|uniref:DUF4124 domain-containing protein n=1 Tax=Shewanella intestini TaxID=2017544 RepID=A0ABS5I242_9GAMM|nr:MULTISPECIES: DUF4124 domain-containing protein [Shewanella]MBR9728097.1 DUF4124 domain-containing protein [Shewanella intestini]MRG36568.1 DUF4124 domain-containing protein [Shewanella sp. XMDDZSB0408]